MLKISGNRLGEYNKSCRIFTKNPTKLSLHFLNFLQFYMDFRKFSNSQLLLKIHFCTGVLRKIQNLTNTPLVHEKHPRTNWGLAIRPLSMGGAGKFRRAGRAPGRGNGGARPRAHLGSVGDRCWGGDRASVGARRKPAAAAAVARLRRRRGLGRTTSGT
jgi:hypothetical protein